MTRSSNVLCFVSSKGGSGKTVTSASLGTFLSELGFKTLLIDTDAATNGLTLLFLEQLLSGSKLADKKRSVGLFDAKPKTLPTIVRVADNLSFIPAAFRLKDTETADPSVVSDVIKSTLDNTTDFHVVLIDAQAGGDEFARVAAAQSDMHIIVSEYDPVSAQGIDRLKLIFSNELTPTTTYILFNKVLSEFASAIGEGLAVARYLPPVPWDADVVRAFARRDLAINMDAPNPYTLAISQIAFSCLGDLTGPAIEKWRTNSLAKVTDPIEARLETLRKAYDDLEKSRRKNASWSNISRFMIVVIAGVAGIMSNIFEHYLANLFTQNYGSSIFSLVIFSVIVGVTLIPSIFVKRSSGANEKTEDVLKTEIMQLETTLLSARAALTVTEPGLYSNQRRAKARQTTES